VFLKILCKLKKHKSLCTNGKHFGGEKCTSKSVQLLILKAPIYILIDIRQAAKEVLEKEKKANTEIVISALCKDSCPLPCGFSE
jgi:hypothetical protein